MVRVTRGGLLASVAVAIVGPLLAVGTGIATAGSAAARAASAAPGAAGMASAWTGRATASTPEGAVLLAVAPRQPEGPRPSNVFVEVNPSTVKAGYLVEIRASCRDNSIPAVVWSDAFGRVQVRPSNGLLTATPKVRERTQPGSYRVKLECRGGETASTMLQVVKSVRPSRGPATGFGGSAGDVVGGLLLPVGIALTVTGLVVWLVSVRRFRGAARR
ncbi:hypothetical protein [Salinispora arenicola]|uniref:Uncharacterized protein n=1 Tax=Salinispora arenicola (strain CNS-205) TaxID=391037 RepID=A8LWT5_SALAI|nr:hypothetical protein [Salinispora arenicola]NIL61372.1 hypothetical protein [Salinispora arenicola]